MSDPINLAGFDLASLDEDGEARVRYTGSMKYLISVSQLKLIPPSHKGCPRKWALMYLTKLPKIPNEALIDGVFLHRCLQNWFQMPEAEWILRWRSPKFSPTGKAWQWYAELALAMLRHVPEQERAEGISEATFFLEIPELDIAIYIKPDFLNTKKFRDWKSTSARVKTSPWVLQESAWWGLGGVPALARDGQHFTIENDIQSRVYAHGLMQLLGWDVIDAEWVYGCKKFSPGAAVKTWPARARFERGETEQWVRKHVYPLLQFAIAMQDAWQKKDLDSPLLMPANPSSCESKGRFCDAWTTCKLYRSPVALGSLHLPIIPQ